MSFFYDFLDYFRVDDVSDKTSIVAVIGVGLMITGKIKILSLSDELVEVKSFKEKLSVFGNNLIIKSVSKGEIVISGKVTKIETGEL